MKSFSLFSKQALSSTALLALLALISQGCGKGITTVNPSASVPDPIPAPSQNDKDLVATSDLPQGSYALSELSSSIQTRNANEKITNSSIVVHQLKTPGAISDSQDTVKGKIVGDSPAMTFDIQKLAQKIHSTPDGIYMTDRIHYKNEVRGKKGVSKITLAPLTDQENADFNTQTDMLKSGHFFSNDQGNERESFTVLKNNQFIMHLKIHSANKAGKHVHMNLKATYPKTVKTGK